MNMKIPKYMQIGRQIKAAPWNAGAVVKVQLQPFRNFGARSRCVFSTTLWPRYTGKIPRYTVE